MMNLECSSQLSYSPPSIKSGGESSPDLNSPTTPLLSSGTAFLSHKRKAGRKKFQETRHPVYRGVRHKDGGKWVCEVREPNKKTRIWVGTYPSPELAARAYDVAALALRGNLAALNFPDSVWLAPRAKSSSARDIRFAALQATRFDLLSPSTSTSSCGDKSEEQQKEASECRDICVVKGLEDSRGLFLDEEAIFNMPGLIDSMAEGMLLTPPSLKGRTTNWDEIDEGANSFIELDLW